MSEKNIIGVRFQRAGKVHYFDAAGIELKVNDYVLIETKHGLEMGRVVIAPQQVIAAKLTEPLQPILRKAGPEDLHHWSEVEKKEEEARCRCKELVTKFGLPMKILAIEANFEGNYLIIYFSAPRKVDFRLLARNLATSVKAKVEFRQVGSREAAKLVGGFGRCGSPLCCTTFLTEFSPVSIKMAKDQNLSPDPGKSSGVCGHLLCCLGYESEQYHHISEKLPQLEQQITTSLGRARVVGRNLLKETVTVQLENQVILEISLTEIITKSG
jgi:cell fate regulator YaaT (PSP1 superfamily)